MFGRLARDAGRTRGRPRGRLLVDGRRAGGARLSGRRRPDHQPDWPGYEVFVEERPDTTGLRARRPSGGCATGARAASAGARQAPDRQADGRTVHEEALTTELPRAGAHADPTARITAVAGALMLGALAAALQEAARGGDAVAARRGCGARTVRARPARRGRDPAPSRAAWRRVVAVVPVASACGVGYFGDGRHVYGCRTARRARSGALIALAALGGVVLLADDLRTGRRLVTPWQRLTGATAAPTGARGGRWRGSR